MCNEYNYDPNFFTPLHSLVNTHLVKVIVAELIASDTTKVTICELIYSNREDPTTIWPNGIPPDGTPIEVEHFPYPAVMGVIYTYSILGVLFALACLAFNIVFRKKT